MNLVIIICIVLGLPGVGKTHLKFLLLDQEPPHLRTSTNCAESPIRIEIRTVTGTRLQTIGGRWQDVEGEEKFDSVAEMILVAEPEASFETEQLSNESELAEPPVQTKSSSNVFSRIINWIKGGKKSPDIHSDLDKAAEPDSASPLEEAAGMSDGSAPFLSPDVSDACQKAMKVIMDKLVRCMIKVKGRKGGAEMSKFNLKSRWVYFNDSGGQPEYHELLPLFVRRLSSVLCVVRLPDKLDETQAVEYFKDGKRVGDTHKSQFTAKDTVKCLVNTMQAYSTQDHPPKIIVVGTHLDKLEEREKEHAKVNPDSASALVLSQPRDDCLPSSEFETLEEKDKQLLEMLEPDFSKQLVYYSKSSSSKKLIFPLNTLKRGEHEKAVAELIRKSVETSEAHKVKVPIWWYIMDLLLQELAKELGRGVLSRAECLQMARLLNIKEDDFDAALVYFDELNIIKYSPDVLPGVVFVDSQIPLDKVSELIFHSYFLRQPPTCEPAVPLDTEWEHFRDRGVVSKECLKKFDRHYFPGIFCVDDLVKFLKQRLVLAPIPKQGLATECEKELTSPCGGESTSTTDKMETHFVMPTLLRTLTKVELENYRFSSPVAATLLVRFPQGCRRSGVFCCFVVHLIRHCGWDLLLETNEVLYRNCIKMRLRTSPPTSVVLIDSNSFIEVHVNASPDISVGYYAEILPVIKEAILSGIFAACKALNYKQTKPHLTFYCPHTSPSVKITQGDEVPKPKGVHTATLDHKRKYWSCDLDPDAYFGPLEQRHAIWFGLPRGMLTILPKIALLFIVSLHVCSCGIKKESSYSSCECNCVIKALSTW